MTSPLSSPCTITHTPMVRVVRPQLFCHTFSRPPSSASNVMSKISAKFCPRQCDVAAWMARPFVGMSASTVVVYSPPANFSFSDLRPLMTGTASSSSYTRAYKSRICSTSTSASALVANAEWPSCHRNSRVRRKGVGCLNSHRTMLVHWLSLRGKSRWLRIHLAYAGYMMVSDVGRMAMGSASSDCPLRVTHATSAAKPSRWSSSASSAALGTNRGKYAFCTPSFLISPSKKLVMCSQTRYDQGRRM
mmetsp:Transcript_7164/g.25558  ORF Transcript_7164/g.25558 Transcript_7164/m.25558 type:complete len:247 (-) Transcript_7164:298-1038(-)